MHKLAPQNTNVIAFARPTRHRHHAAIFPLDDDDMQLMHRLETLQLDATEWTHEAHMHAPWIALQQQHTHNCANMALPRMRTAIQTFNARVPQRPHAHQETIAVAFPHVMAHRLAQSQNQSWKDFAHQNNDLITSNPLLQFHSAECLFSDAARVVFVPPDSQPLPFFSENGNSNVG